MSSRIALVKLLALALLAPSNTVVQSAPTALPDNLKVPGHGVVTFEAHATGTQIYACAPQANDPSTFEWTLKGPEAELWNGTGEKIGRHYPGPTWEANDGSRVVAEAVERANAPQPDAVPWLLLRAKSAEGCGRSTAGAERAVPYQATYTFA